MIEERNFAMRQKASPLGFRQVCRLALNGEQTAPGIFAKRRGITTTVTVDLVIGQTAPFRPIRWKIGSNYYLVAVGSDSDAFLNPWNNWLYARSPTFLTELSRIYSTPTYVIKEPWGIAVPVVTGTATNLGTTGSLFGSGGYLYAVTAWNEILKVESEPVFIEATGFPAVSGLETIKLVWIGGMGWSATIPAVTPPANATAIRYYRERMVALRVSGSSYEVAITGDASHLRFIDEKTDGATWTDSGGQPLSRLLDYCYDVVPWAARSAPFRDGWLYLTATESPCTHKLVKSNPMCPETYAGNKKSVIAETDAGLIQGQSEWAVPVDCGVPTGLAVQGGVALVLCDHGGWRFVDGRASGLYDLLQDHTWVGCVSAATIAHSPEGVWWLAKEGVVLWRGSDSQPEVITLDIIDTTDSDTPFATDLSGAMGAYDVARHEYKVIVPKSGGGQFLLTVRGDRLPNEVVVGKWTFGASLPTVTGMGYDWYTDQVIYFFGAYNGPLTAKAETAATYTEGASASTYDFGVEEWWGEVGGRAGETKRAVAVRIFLHRTDTTTAQTVNVTLQGLRTSEETTAPTATELTWKIGETEPKSKESATDILGRVVKVTLTNTDAKPLEFRCVQIGHPEEIRNVHEVV
jgi:hypothetical protein